MSPTLILEFVILAALWGASFLFMYLGASEFGPVATAGLRVSLAAICLMPVLLKPRVFATFRAHWRKILAVGLLNSGVPFLLFSFAVLHITTGLSAILNATVPLTGALVAWVWLKDRPGAWRAAGLAIGFTGVTMLVVAKSAGDVAGVTGGRGTSTLSLLAIGACLLATTCYGIAASFAKRHLSGVDPLATAAGSQLGAALALVGPMAYFWPDTAPSAKAWAAIAAVAVFCTAVAYIIFFRLIERAGPSKALTVTFLVPVFALVYGVLLLGEAVSPWMIGCGLVILLGTALSSGLVRPPAVERPTP